MVEPAKEQNKRGRLPMMGEGRSQNISRFRGGGEKGVIDHVSHCQMGGLGETQYASPSPPHLQVNLV